MTKGQQLGLLIVGVLVGLYFLGPRVGLAEYMPAIPSFGGDSYEQDDAWWKAHRSSGVHRLAEGEPFWKMSDTGHGPHGHHR